MVIAADSQRPRWDGCGFHSKEEDDHGIDYGGSWPRMASVYVLFFDDAKRVKLLEHASPKVWVCFRVNYVYYDKKIN
jgi:hypothetical protein